MRAVIVYESIFGSTKKAAEAIADGLADGAEVSVVPVTAAMRTSSTARISWCGRSPPHPRDVQAEYPKKARNLASKPG